MIDKYLQPLQLVIDSIDEVFALEDELLKVEHSVDDLMVALNWTAVVNHLQQHCYKYLDHLIEVHPMANYIKIKKI